MFTKEGIEKEYEKVGAINYSWDKSLTSNSTYDLLIFIGNCAYRVASYSLKTKKVIIHHPEVHIPQAKTIEQFIEFVKSKGDNEIQS